MYPAIVAALSAMSDETVIDGAVLHSMSPGGRPSIPCRTTPSVRTPILYYVFDILILSAEDLTSESLMRRRQVLQSHVLSKLAEPIRESQVIRYVNWILGLF